MESVTEDRAPVIITRDRGKAAAILMSLEDFASFEETQNLLASPRNAERLLAAIAGLENGAGTVHTLID